MKRRLVKKWMNRYIKPLIKDMPEVNFRVMELVNESDPSLRYISRAENYTCINGEWRAEGEKGAPSRGLRKDIQKTAEALKDKVDSFANPRLRTIEAKASYGFYMRIVDFSDWPEGYVYRPYEEDM